MRRLFDVFYGTLPAEFESDFGLEESVKRLTAATERSVFGLLKHEAAVGRVSRDRVSLQRVIPFIGNSFKPFYVGRFREINGRVVLAGEFTVLGWVKAFMTCWLGFCAFWTVMTAALAFTRESGAWWFPVAGAGNFAVGLGFVAFSRWLARNDVPWLEKVIEDALSGCCSNPVTWPAR